MSEWAKFLTLPDERGTLGNRYCPPDTIKALSEAANLWRTFAEALRKAKTPAAAATVTAA